MVFNCRLFSRSINRSFTFPSTSSLLFPLEFFYKCSAIVLYFSWIFFKQSLTHILIIALVPFGRRRFPGGSGGKAIFERKAFIFRRNFEILVAVKLRKFSGAVRIRQFLTVEEIRRISLICPRIIPETKKGWLDFVYFCVPKWAFSFIGLLSRMFNKFTRGRIKLSFS